MKKLLIAVLVAFCSISMYAQNTLVALTADTAKAAETITLSYPTAIYGYYTYDFALWQSRIYGTDTFAIYLQESNDNSNWTNLDTISTIDSATNVNGVFSSATVFPSLYMRASLTADAGDTVILDAAIKLKNLYKKSKSFSHAMNSDGDTITNAASANYAYPTKIDGLYTYSVQAVFDEITGSASCVCKLQTSNDNSNWIDISGETNTFTADGSYVFSNTSGFTGEYLRMNVTCTGTQTSVTDGTIVLKEIPID